MQCLRGVEALTERGEGYLRDLLSKRIPDTTMYVTAAKLNPADFADMNQAQIRTWNRSKSLTPEGFPCGIIAVDGKSVQRTSSKVHPESQEKRKKGTNSVYYDLRMMRAVLISSAAKVCIEQSVIPGNSNDMGHFECFYSQLSKQYNPLFEIVTADAGFASAKNAQLVNDSGKGYVIGLKGNQKTLLEEAARLLTSDQRPAHTTDWEVRGSSRIRRTLYRTDEMAGYMDFPGLRQAFLVRQESHRVKKNKKGDIIIVDGSQTVEDRYFLSNLTRNYLSPKQILTVVRYHWGIENDHNWSMDTRGAGRHGLLGSQGEWT